MAHLETVQTGLRVVTYVRGRVVRSQDRGTRPVQGVHDRLRSAAKRRRRICLLSARDAELLEMFGVAQPCSGQGCRHSHHTREEMERMVAQGDVRWVGRTENVVAWRDARQLAVRRSAGVSTVQLVEVGA